MGIVGIASDGLVEIRHRAIELAELLVSHAPVAQGKTGVRGRRLAVDDRGTGGDDALGIERAVALRALRDGGACEQKAQNENREGSAKPQNPAPSEEGILGHHMARETTYGCSGINPVAAPRLCC